MDLKRASVLGYILAVLAIIGLAAEGSIIGTGVIAITVQVLAVLLMVWARLTFGRRSFHVDATATEGGLVTSGPYKFIRHPIYAAVLYFVWAGALSNITAVSLLLGVLTSAGLAVRIIAEERFVTQQYPDYASYAARTKRIIPFVL